MPCVVFLLLLFNPFDDPQIDAFMNDFPAARTRAVALDQQILQDAAAVSKKLCRSRVTWDSAGHGRRRDYGALDARWEP